MGQKGPKITFQCTKKQNINVEAAERLYHGIQTNIIDLMQRFADVDNGNFYILKNIHVYILYISIVTNLSLGATISVSPGAK